MSDWQGDPAAMDVRCAAICHGGPVVFLGGGLAVAKLGPIVGLGLLSLFAAAGSRQRLIILDATLRIGGPELNAFIDTVREMGTAGEKAMILKNQKSENAAL